MGTKLANIVIFAYFCEILRKMRQKTIKTSCRFEGKGLHTGGFAHMTVNPAPAGSGIAFHRTDLGSDAIVKASASNVSNTARSTTISNGEVSAVTVEHIMSALAGLGIDNARIEIDGPEVPILDGSAKPYVKAILETGIVEQDAERVYSTIDKAIEIKDEKSGSWIKIEPAEEFSFDIIVDFNSKVLGEQRIIWDGSKDYATEIAPCRTFVFFHELELLFKNNLIKGGDVDNAIVVVEHPVSDGQLDDICALLNKPKLSVNANGYLNNLELHFNDECGRHKLLDLIGDLRLCGFLKAKVSAFKPGHSLNTRAAKAIIESIEAK